MKKVYLAGWDVFKPESKELGEEFKELCAQYGLNGLYPLDNNVQTAYDIYQGNIKLINEADCLVANGNAFRGDEMDTGTAFEVGYAVAKGKPVIVYMDDVRPLKDKVMNKQGCEVEDFDLPVNLMVGVSTQIVKGSIENALKCLI